MANKLALVTGASSGIGLSLAQESVGRGYDVIVSSAGGRLNKVAQALRAASAEILEVQADLASREGVESLRNKVTALGRKLDIAFINAGVGHSGKQTSPGARYRGRRGGVYLRLTPEQQFSTVP